MEEILQQYLKKTISIRDTFVQKQMKENFYHGILLGILGIKERWAVSSNRESGDGYSDILTAKHAGIPCVFVTWGQGNLDDCKEYKDSLIVNDILELERALMNLL